MKLINFWIHFLFSSGSIVLLVLGTKHRLCQNGVKPSKECTPFGNECDDNTYCMELDPRDRPHDPNRFGCCAWSLCFETGMLSVVEDSEGYVDWLWDSLTTFQKQHWYEQNVEMTPLNVVAKAACPKPYSFQLFDQQILARNFEESLSNSNDYDDEEDKKKKMTWCRKNGDCRADEFCGHLHNPSFCDDRTIEKLRKKCIDHSNEGKQLLYCFKSPGKSGQLKLRIDRNGVGVKLCSNHTECQQHFPNQRSVCVMGDPMKEIDEDGKPTGRKKRGLCYEASICNKENHIGSKIASPPNATKNCAIGKPQETCPGKNPECVKFDHNNRFCCEMKPEEKVTTVAVTTTEPIVQNGQHHQQERVAGVFATAFVALILAFD